MSQTQQSSDTTFDHDVLKSEVPVLVDFYAEWCAPCHAIAPIVEDLARTYEGQAKTVKVDIDEAPHLAATYNVRSVPTLLLIKDGAVVDQIIGTVSKSVLEDRLKRVVHQTH